MPQETTYPRWFADILDHARKAKNLPMNKEIAEIFWAHVKKYSENEEIVIRAFYQMIESGDYMEPANVIKHIPREYEDTTKNWPTRREVEQRQTSGIAKDCISLINKKMGSDPFGFKRTDEKTLTKKEYYDGMVDLHDKYPKAGFLRAAQEYAKRSGLAAPKG